jgi:hypothetical protein
MEIDFGCNSLSEIAVGDYVKRKTTNANRNKKAIRSVAKRGFGFAKRDGGSSFKGLALAA